MGSKLPSELVLQDRRSHSSSERCPCTYNLPVASFTTTPTSINHLSLCTPSLPPSTITLLDLPPLPQFNPTTFYTSSDWIPSLFLFDFFTEYYPLPRLHFGTTSIALILLFGKTLHLQPVCGCSLLHYYRFPIYFPSSVLQIYLCPRCLCTTAHSSTKLPTVTSLNCLPRVQTTANANCTLPHTTAYNHSHSTHVNRHGDSYTAT